MAGIDGRFGSPRDQSGKAEGGSDEIGSAADGLNSSAVLGWAYYCDGVRVNDHTTYPAALAAARRGKGFVWIGLLEPTAEQIAGLGDEFGLHPLALEDAVKAHQRPKLEQYAGGEPGQETLFAVFKTVRYVPHDELTASSEVVETGDVMVFCGSGFVVTVRHGRHGELTGLRQSLEAEPARLAKGPGAVLHAIADLVVDTYLKVADEVQLDIDLVEAEMFSPRGWRNIERVYQLKREVLELRRAVAPLAEPLRSLSERDSRLVPSEIRLYFRDVDDHLQRVRDQIAGFDELLSSILAAGLAQVQVAENEDMRRIAAWVAILAADTMLAGIYGMNFDHMPELTTRYGYYVVLGAMALLSVALFVFFKRKRWL
ncbi:magnesium and cobalt transport protein CorA [Kribbella sp. CA-294648]|uniref:magnesium and cobalt transport protein CorA n=1 Tax=Kribbella sp. CA-294648 TaxID=3239948 RepID=UPI003D92344E